MRIWVEAEETERRAAWTRGLPKCWLAVRSESPALTRKASDRQSHHPVCLLHHHIWLYILLEGVKRTAARFVVSCPQRPSVEEFWFYTVFCWMVLNPKCYVWAESSNEPQMVGHILYRSTPCCSILHEHFMLIWERRPVGRLFMEGIQAEKTISGVLPLHFYRTDLWLLVCWETTPQGLLYFFFFCPVMSCLLCGLLSRCVWWHPPFTMRAVMRRGTFLALFCFPCRQKSVTRVRGRDTASSASTKKPYWNLPAVQSRYKSSTVPR